MKRVIIQFSEGLEYYIQHLISFGLFGSAAIHFKVN